MFCFTRLQNVIEKSFQVVVLACGIIAIFYVCINNILPSKVRVVNRAVAEINCAEGNIFIEGVTTK